jgi:hypothetical protein
VSYSWPQFKEAVSGALAFLTRVLKFKRQILALVVFFSFVAVMFVVAYMGRREPLVDQDEAQTLIALSLSDPTVVSDYNYPKAYEVVLESIDEIEGTVHLRADLKMRWALSFDYVDERFKTEEMRKKRFPVQVRFGPFTVHENPFLDWSQFERPPKIDQRPAIPLVPPDYSKVQPTSTQTDVSLQGDPWFYPFDKYLIDASVHCEIFATPDLLPAAPPIPPLKGYFLIPGDGYSLSSKLPNFLVRNATERDVESFLKEMRPDTNPKEGAKKFRPDTWRDGTILVVLERPLFLKFFAGFFLILAIVVIGVIIMYSDTKQLGLNIFGYFLALWAIRAPLAAGAPKVPILMDYVTLGLYALLVAAALSKFIWGFSAKPD